jgi:hypothetical protein
MYEILQTIQNVLVGTTGDLYLYAIGVIAFFLIAFLMLGMDFRFALALCSPLVMGFSYIGWIPKWIALILWIVVVGFGIFIVVNYWRERI